MDTDYLDAVLELVAEIPPGRVMTYGAIAEVVADRLEAQGLARRGGPRQVGAIMSRAGGGVPWWRVVAADGRVVQAHRSQALATLRSEGTPLTSDDDDGRVRVRVAIWFPPEAR